MSRLVLRALVQDLPRLLAKAKQEVAVLQGEDDHRTVLSVE